MTYNEIIRKSGKRIKKHVYYVDENDYVTTIDDSDIETIKLIQSTPLIGTAMSGCELNLKEPISGKIYVTVEVKYQNETASKNYGPYYLKEEPQYNADAKNYTHVTGDEMIKSMVDYEAVNINYPCSVYDFFIKVVEEAGYSTNIQSLPNGALQMPQDIYTGINYTYRDVLDDIAVANGVLLYVENGEVLIGNLNSLEIAVIDDDILKKQNISFGEHFGPINSIVLSRSGGSDNIYLNDQQSIDENGLCEFKISDNQLMNRNDRDAYLPALLNQLDGIQYDIYDTELVGYGDIKPLQKIIFYTGDNSYSSYLFNSEITLTDGYKQAIYNELPEETETDYKAADKTDKRLNQAYIIVNKQEQEIEALVSKTQIVSNELLGTGSITLSNAYEGFLHRLEINGNIKCVFPSSDLYPSSNLYTKDTYLIVDNNKYHLDFTYLNYMNSEVYDKWICEDGKQWVERNVGVNQQGNMYALDEPIIEEKEDLVIEVKNNSVISLESFSNAILKCLYLLDNEYTNNFATTVDVSSEIKVQADRITEAVKQVADEDGNITSASIILAVNKDQSSAEITANKINLNGIVTANNNFKILEDGSMEAKNGKFTGEINGGAVRISGDYSERDPYIYVESPNSTSIEPINTSIWSDGISCINYGEGIPVIRTEKSDGYAELAGSEVNAFAFNNISLEERKKDFEKLKNALSILNDIDIYKYRYKGDREDSKKHIGLVIGDNYKYSKEVTSQSNKEVDMYSLISVCCQAIKELEEEIKELKRQINSKEGN